MSQIDFSEIYSHKLELVFSNIYQTYFYNTTNYQIIFSDFQQKYSYIYTILDSN